MTSVLPEMSLGFCFMRFFVTQKRKCSVNTVPSHAIFSLDKRCFTNQSPMLRAIVATAEAAPLTGPRCGGTCAAEGCRVLAGLDTGALVAAVAGEASFNASEDSTGAISEANVASGASRRKW